MSFNEFVNQQLAEERMKDAMRQAEQARLVRAVEGSTKSWGWRLPMLWTLKSFSVGLRDWLAVALFGGK